MKKESKSHFELIKYAHLILYNSNIVTEKNNIRSNKNFLIAIILTTKLIIKETSIK